MIMEKYDVVIIGGGLGSLTTATYLSKRLRNIAVFEEGKRKKIQKYSKRIRDDQYRMFEFRFFNHDLGGVHPGGLFYEYIKRCGLTESFEYYDNQYHATFFILKPMLSDYKLEIGFRDSNNFINYSILYNNQYHEGVE